jgi:hypothetical protein
VFRTLRLSALILIAGPALVAAAFAAWSHAPAVQVATETPAPAQTEARIFFSADSLPAPARSRDQRPKIHSLLNIRSPMRFGDHLWDDRGVPPGPVWIRIDLARQIISIFRAGHEIGSAVILFGTDGKPTPVGEFHIIERAREHRSNLYDAEMPFMLRLTRDGVAIHASKVLAGSATHGCIGIPMDFASRVFDEAKRGDLVIIEKGNGTVV